MINIIGNNPRKISRSPRYKGTIVCDNCNAEYRPFPYWCYGYYEGTSSIFNPVRKIPEGTCPVCRTPHKVEKS